MRGFITIYGVPYPGPLGEVCGMCRERITALVGPHEVAGEPVECQTEGCECGEQFCSESCEEAWHDGIKE